MNKTRLCSRAKLGLAGILFGAMALANPISSKADNEGYLGILADTFDAQSGNNPCVKLYTTSILRAGQKEEDEKRMLDAMKAQQQKAQQEQERQRSTYQQNQNSEKQFSFSDDARLDKIYTPAGIKYIAEQQMREKGKLDFAVIQALRRVKQQTDPYDLENKTIFTVNRWLDLNGDNFVSFEEYQGVKNQFYEGEQCFIISKPLPNVKFHQIIYGPNGDVLSDFTVIGEENKIFGVNPRSWDSFFKPIFNRGGVGSYKVAVYYEDKLKATHDFEIIPRPK